MGRNGEKWAKIGIFVLIAGIILWVLPKIIMALLSFFAAVFFIGFAYGVWKHHFRRSYREHHN